MKKKLTPFFLLIISAFLTISAQEYSFYDLNKENPGWTMVPGGNILCPPQKTSYGYAALCEGKSFAGFSEKGKLLWQKSVREKPSLFFTTGCGDTIWFISKSKKINLLNPEGQLLWTADCGFEVKENPLQGKDGRVFLRGKNDVACYALNGSLRWKKEIKDQNVSLPLGELNDGSILVFLSELENNKSKAVRITPFGEIKETILFSGEAVQRTVCQEGIIMAFTDGSAGLCTVRNGQSVSGWVYKNDAGGIPYISETVNDSALTGLVYTSEVVFLKSASGEKVYSVNLSGDKHLSRQNIKFAFTSGTDFYACDKENAFCLNQAGNLLWKARLPLKTTPFIFLTDSDYLVTCTSSWSVLGYRMQMGVSKKQKPQSKKRETAAYSCFYETVSPSDNITGRALSDTQIAEMEMFFSTEKKKNSDRDSSAKEAYYLSVLDAEITQILAESMVRDTGHSEIPYFRQNAAYTQKIINLASKTGLNVFQKKYVSLLRKTSASGDNLLLLSLVSSAGNFGLDTDGELLDALDYVLSKADLRDTSVLNSICDSVFKICNFMGKPMLLEKGRHIISRIMNGRYQQESRDYARSILEKIVKAGR
ncbi:hypothetical protein DYE49_05485 [Treponema rectale]|uniref:Outer membrane protein assembly factor BamB, contains PQQ-like beta-propeller repeat n=1 Tax=Treponema rectale TaxID=744512 RepID=A0A840S727_9SPIR|nr:PQQ-binding-like beta-propeller repeat protein [Treponema rectale]MBB5218369.1 hypothetical protein [Treponema rectale]QOS39935.1 hypothetical protein DYE49_05485 [Treponema rectale]